MRELSMIELQMISGGMRRPIEPALDPLDGAELGTPNAPASNTKPAGQPAYANATSYWEIMFS